MQLGNMLAQGNTADIYLSEDSLYTIKLFHARFTLDNAHFEADKQKIAYEYATGFYVPKTIKVAKIHERAAIIMEYFPGVDLAEKMLVTEDSFYMREFVHLQNLMHQVKPFSLPSLKDKLSQQIKETNFLTKIQQDTLCEQLHKMKYESVLCHGDFHPKNIICCQDAYAIIDWVDASFGDALADAYRSYLILMQNAPGFASLYLSMYCKETGASPSDIFRWEPFVCAARLGENLSVSQQKQLMQLIFKYI